MDKRTFTLSEMADILAKAANRDDDYAVYVHRRLREFQRNRSLPWASYLGQGRTASAIFDERAIFLCAIVLHLSDAPMRFNLGEQIDLMQVIRDAEANPFPPERPDSMKTEGGAIGKDDIKAPIRGIRFRDKEGKNERWNFQITVRRDLNKDGQPIEFYGRWRSVGETPNSERADSANDADGRPVLARIEIPLNLIFEPIIAILDAEA